MEDRLYQEVRAHFNEPVLIHFELCRVIGYAEDDDDCYMIVSNRRKDKPVWVTMVGGYTYLDRLKEQGITIPLHPTYEGEVWTDFSRLDSLLELNGSPRAQEMLLLISEPQSPTE